jgi:hypothetical protein
MSDRGPLVRRLLYALVGVAMGGIGIGWHGCPSDAAIVAAIHGRSVEYARATIALHAVRRDWLHEVFGIANSRFLVTATVTAPDGAGGKRCFAVEPAPIPGTAIAFGPYAEWRCTYPALGG